MGLKIVHLVLGLKELMFVGATTGMRQLLATTPFTSLRGLRASAILIWHLTGCQQPTS